MKQAISYFLIMLSWLAYIPMVFFIFQDFDLKMAVSRGAMVCMWPLGTTDFGILAMMAVFLAAFFSEEAMERFMLITVLSFLIPIILESLLRI